MENIDTTPTPTSTTTPTTTTPTTATAPTGENAATTAMPYSGLVSRETIDNLALWLGSTVSGAFFSSLDRFSCVNISTDDVDDDDEDEADDISLAPSNSSSSSSSSSVTVDCDHSRNDASKLPV